MRGQKTLSSNLTGTMNQKEQEKEKKKMDVETGDTALFRTVFLVPFFKWLLCLMALPYAVLGVRAKA